ncbi:BatD family protein [Thiofilum flexile]|uniref:BatD family protein n=1 Tax=Thiofilum flexile TaxID=125627 RepID=UPI00037CA0CB|nr:BatD family protein [Thiofilum flexile]
MVKRILIAGLIWFSTVGYSWAAVQSSVDQTELAYGDAIELTITATDHTTVAPDLSVLDQDFEISSQRQEELSSSINGRVTQTSRWVLSLYPRKAGQLIIPAIVVGNESTDPIRLTVSDSTSPSASNNKNAPADILIEFDIEPKAPLVQQQVILTQRLLASTRLDNTQASLTLPQIEQGKGLLRQLGSPTAHTIVRNSKRYEVIERKFALMAQQSGTLTIGRTIFEGVIPDPNANNNNDPLGRYFAFSLGGKNVRRFSKPFDITVAPQDPLYTGKDWLPAKNISLNASWDKPLDSLQAGEPVTLTIAIMADGLTAEQLPALTIPVPVGMKAYSDQPLLNDQVREEGIIGIRQEKWVFIASGGGDFNIPEMTLDWWNTETQQQELAQLDATQFKVGGEPWVADPPAKTEANTAPQPAHDNTVAATPPKAEEPVVNPRWAGWLWAALLAFIVLVVGAIAYRHGKKQGSQNHNPVQDSLQRGSLNHLLKACAQQDKQAAQLGLTAWARDVLALPSPQWVNLRAIASQDLKTAMNELEQALYSKEGGDKNWEGANLAKAVKEFKYPPTDTNTSSHLMPLYPVYK